MKLQYLTKEQFCSTMQPCTDCTILRREIVNLRGFVSDCFSTMLKRFDGQDQNIQWLMEAMQTMNLKMEEQPTESTVTDCPRPRRPRQTGSAARKRARMQIEHRIAAAQSQRLAADQQSQSQQKLSINAVPPLQTANSAWNSNTSAAIPHSPNGNMNGASGFSANYRPAITCSSISDSTSSAAVSSHGYRMTGPPNAVHMQHQQIHGADQHQHETESDEDSDIIIGESTGATIKSTGTVLIKTEPLGAEFFEETSASNMGSETGREEGEIVAVDDESVDGCGDGFGGFMDDESFKDVNIHRIFT